MNLTVTQPVEIEVDAIRVELAVKYEEEDIPNDFPLRKGNMWEATIDIDTGQIRGWPAGAGERQLSMKVTDSGCYYLMSGDKTVGQIEQNYVPKCIPGKYGDYVDLKIDASGRITNWEADSETVMDSFFADSD